jgi:hypothetical protein
MSKLGKHENPGGLLSPARQVLVWIVTAQYGRLPDIVAHKGLCTLLMRIRAKSWLAAVRCSDCIW